MKFISVKPVVDKDKCIGCGICSKVCPSLAITLVERKAVVNEADCRGCGGCNQRCPVYAIEMVKLDHAEITELCQKAMLNPEQVICYCTATRAEEVAGAILKGAKSPEEISRLTGIRMGCKVECIQPILRLLDAAGIKPERPNGFQWYGLTPKVWEISEKVKAKYADKGFYFEEDIKLLKEVVAATPERGSSK
jgi:Pyruvate/2-oxoacid:ferredoxin oxidoreductase delta subunit/bacterioferritin-associated ferredoxin